MSELMDILANGAFWVAVLRTATPLLLGTLGVLLCERSTCRAWVSPCWPRPCRTTGTA